MRTPKWLLLKFSLTGMSLMLVLLLSANIIDKHESDKMLIKDNLELSDYITGVLTGINQVPEERKTRLNEIADYISDIQKERNSVKLTFICTHNSRRSHMAQIWAQVAAEYYGLETVQTYSGGTEATAFNPRAVAAIERSGLLVSNPGGNNPKYEIKISENSGKMICFSKTYDDKENPSEEFAAIMTCSDADEACPIVPGAEYRMAIPYIDPKVSDGTSEETATYDERCKQIATEMFYLMSQIKS